MILNRTSKAILSSWLLIATAGILVVDCNYTPPVLGQEDVLVIIASVEDRPLLEPLLMDVFDHTMATPAPESYYQIRWESPVDFEDFQHYKNLIIASLAFPSDSTGDILIQKILGEERVAEAREGGNPIFVSSDYLARGQMFMALSALDAVHARQEIIRLNTWIFDQFEQQLRIRQHESVYKYRTERKLERELEEKYDWHLSIQQGYITVKELPEKNFVWLGKGYPYQWLAVHWIDQADTITITPDWAWRHMEYAADSLFEDIYMDSLFRSIELGTENGHNIYILRGIWGHDSLTAGGPFFTYAFRDREQNRVYFITGLIFNPSGTKALLIRRQEVVSRTFHTFEKPPSSTSQSPNNNLI